MQNCVCRSRKYAKERYARVGKKDKLIEKNKDLSSTDYGVNIVAPGGEMSRGGVNSISQQHEWALSEIKNEKSPTTCSPLILFALPFFETVRKQHST